MKYRPLALSASTNNVMILFFHRIIDTIVDQVLSWFCTHDYRYTTKQVTFKEYAEWFGINVDELYLALKDKSNS